jgi:fatty acid desaturase
MQPEPAAAHDVARLARSARPGTWDAATGTLSEEDQEAFGREVAELRREIFASMGDDDVAHLRSIERFGRAATALGLLTCWIAPNPLSAGALAIGRSTRWLLMHHVGHRGYDRIPGVPERYTSRVFARGRRRFLDWPDWMIPEAWMHEHNVLHHSFTGEEADPDLIERNTAWVHGLPRPARYALLALLGATWRASYYAQATTEAWLSRHGAPPTKSELRRTLVTRCWLPYAALQFGALPLAFLPLGPLASASALANSVMADVLTNLHTFAVVGPNHAGADLFRFDDRAATKAEHYVRQVLGSANFATGGDVVDFAHLWLNYQIEHHLFPDVSMLAYQRVQPKVKALCEKYGLPYVQESVLARFAKMVEIFLGDAKMQRMPAR